MKDERQLLQTLVAQPSSVAILFPAGKTTGTLPAAATDGLSCKGLGKVDLSFFFVDTAQTAVVRIWLMDANGNWQHAQATTTATCITGATRCFIDPFDTGTFDRIFIELVTAPAGADNVTVEMSPQGD